ncbi:MAG: hypothetical protein N2589_03400 [bacterium]|nr:hypothetical protein [bacterium]MCX7917154.1 hypothetical protein [bacterium]MDW8163442.1 hypothetical protein [Candidatus Omnitrophota bacterium]
MKKEKIIEHLKNITEKITGIGSLPFVDLEENVKFVKENFKDIPFLPQLPKLNFKENMNIQVIENMPCIKLEEKKLIFSYSEEEILNAYQKIEENDIEYFKISEEYGIGIYSLLNTEIESSFLKGQVSGPITFLSTVKDKEGKSLIFNEIYEDVFIKILGMKGLWIAYKIEERGKIPIIFYDEPIMGNFGSAFFPIEKNRIENIYKILLDFIRKRNSDVLIGIHCCGNTDWNILLNLDIDILSFDAFEYLEKFFLYWEGIEKFLQKERIVAWGIIPSTNEIENIEFEVIREKLNYMFHNFENKGYNKTQIKQFSLITPSCGLAYINVDTAYKITKYLKFVSQYIQEHI